MKLLAAFGVVVVYLSLSIQTARTKLPFNDEGWLASPGLNLITRGTMGTSALESAGTWLQGINTYTYWVMPLHSLNLAVWYEIFGFSALSMRALSIFWGVIALGAWYCILGKLTKDPTVALLGVTLMAFDYHFIALSAVGRMDMMSAALGFAGIATYLLLRERYFGWSLLASHACFAASCFTHPYGGMALIGWIFLALYFDRNRFRWTRLGLLVIPYVIAAASWIHYIAQDPGAFFSQFTGNAAAGRRFMYPWSAVQAELVDRYLASFGFEPGASALEHVRILILLTYICGAVAAVRSARIRSHRGCRALLVLAGLYLLMMTFGEPKKAELYIVYAIPFWAAILALAAHEWWANSATRRVTAAAVISACMLLQTANTLYAIGKNNYDARYLPVIKFINLHATRETMIMGPSELAFELGFDRNLVDDFNLGYYSGKRAELIVIDQNYRDVIASRRQERQEFDAHIRNLLTVEFRRIYTDGGYDVYARQ